MFYIFLHHQILHMYQTLTFLHSTMRWLVLLGLLWSIGIAYRGIRLHLPFSKTADAVRHWTATILHIQLLIGMLFYIKSPIIQYFWTNFDAAVTDLPTVFFALVHGVLMIAAIAIVTIGSALAKRKKTDREKFKTVLVYYSIALFLIFVAIPWPFSPFANRPYFR